MPVVRQVRDGFRRSRLGSTRSSASPQAAEMKFTYHDQDDILRIEFSEDLVVKDVSHGWNFSVGYSKNGIAEITILDAKAAGHWPPEIVVI